MSKANEISGQPRIVKSYNIRLDTDYAERIADLKHGYRSAQAKVSARVNAEKLLFNWELGRDLVQKKAEERWDAGVVEPVSLDLQREFPNSEGFSAANLWFMMKWYLFYSSLKACEKLYQLGKELEYRKLLQPVREFMQQPVAEMENEKLQQVVREFPSPFGLIHNTNDRESHFLKSRWTKLK